MCIGLHTLNLAELKWTSEDSLDTKNNALPNGCRSETKVEYAECLSVK